MPEIINRQKTLKHFPFLVICYSLKLNNSVIEDNFYSLQAINMDILETKFRIPSCSQTEFGNKQSDTNF